MPLQHTTRGQFKESSANRKVAFLDRDGTINVDYGFVHSPAQWEFTPGAVDAIRLLSQQGYSLAVVTNQSGVAAGKYSAEAVRTLHEFVQQQLISLGLKIDAFAFCPHAADEKCVCRKPEIGMVVDVCSQFDAPIDYRSSWTIGDKPSDVAFGMKLGTRTVLIRSRYWSPADLSLEPSIIADSFYDAVNRIVAT